MAGSSSQISRDLTQGSIRQHLWHMALPAGTGLFFNTMFNVVDTFWAGSVSTTALAALSVSFPVFFFVIALTEGLSIATSALVSFHVGKKEGDRASHFAAQVLIYGILATLVLMSVGLGLAEPIFRFLGASAVWLDLALEYIYVIFYGSVFFVFSSALNGMLLSHGNAAAMRNVLVGGFFLNLLLDPWFLYGGLGLPAMGIAGIAWATVLIKGFSCFYLAIVVRDQRLLPESGSHHWVPKVSSQIRILFHSVPASLNMLTIALGMFVTTYYLRLFGESAVAAFGICLRIEQLALLPTIGLYLASLSIVGQNFGAKLIDRIRSCLALSMRAGLAIMSIGAVCMYSFPSWLVGMFSKDPEVLAYGVSYLRVAAFISWSYAIASICISTLQGMHHPIYAIGVGLIRQFLGRALLFYLVIQYTTWGILGIWWSLFVINWSAALVTLSYTLWVIHRADQASAGT